MLGFYSSVTAMFAWIRLAWTACKDLEISLLALNSLLMPCLHESFLLRQLVTTKTVSSTLDSSLMLYLHESALLVQAVESKLLSALIVSAV
jgi:hypothetical protein